jgi:CRISPR-associated protein Csx17
MNEITLSGCTATPLAGYLKALGVLRLLAAKHPQARGFWRRDTFVLRTDVGRAGIEHFFLHEYTPTPIMAPWNGGSGFYKKDNKAALDIIRKSIDPRFAPYRSCLAIAEVEMAGMNREASPKGEEKTLLLTRIRSQLPDEALDWFDASVLLADHSPQYPPLLGTGGNDGRLDFTNNFMQRLIDVILPDQGNASDATGGWLAMSLFDKPAPGLVKSAIGQFSPGHAGGPNASVGFDADSGINPWDFVLMIEGALLFAAAAVRRNADDPFGVLSYPFTVRAVGAGSGSLGEADPGSSRGELWMPLWSNAASYPEVRALMAEGRVALGKKPARDALDFVRAVQHLGGYRGIASFQRYGLLMRSGKAYLATPLSRIEVSNSPQTPWLDELDKNYWLDRFRRFAQGDNTANRFRILRKRLEDRLFILAGRAPSKASAQAMLILLGEIQHALATSPKTYEVVPPIPHLSDRWVQAADDVSPDFRIAKALAGLRGVRDKPLPLRVQLFPIDRRFDRWMTAEAGEKLRFHTSAEGRLTEILPALLERRLWLADKLEMRDKPLVSSTGATLADVNAFLRDGNMDDRIAALLPGLALCDIPPDTEHNAGEGTAPAAFALMKLALTPDRTLQSQGFLPEGQQLPVPTGMLAQLAAGNRDNRAVKTAWRRLRSSGLAPLFALDTLPSLAGIDPMRAAASLLIPLRYGATAALARSVLNLPEPEVA